MSNMSSYEVAYYVDFKRKEVFCKVSLIESITSVLLYLFPLR